MCAVRQLRPGTGCLWCNGLIDGTQLALEAKTDEERKAQDYGVREPNPSVITLNAVAAGQAVNNFLFDFLDLRPDVESGNSVYQHHYFLRDTVQNVVPRKDPDCRECEKKAGSRRRDEVADGKWCRTANVVQDTIVHRHRRIPEANPGGVIAESMNPAGHGADKIRAKKLARRSGPISPGSRNVLPGSRPASKR